MESGGFPLAEVIEFGSLGFAILGAIVTVTWKIGQKFSRIETTLEKHVDFMRHELSINGGDSLRDRVEEIEKKLTVIEGCQKRLIEKG